MDLWQLKVFLNVVNHKSFSKAGDAIFLSQPTVSSHIKDLEEHFGTPLIDRLGREALPTKAGEMLYGYARQLLALKDEAESAMSALLGNARGELTFGGSTIPATYIIPSIMAAFTEKYPEISLSIVAGDTSSIKTAILEGRVEAGIIGAKVDALQLQQEALMEDEMKVILSTSHPWAMERLDTVSPEMLFNTPFIGREKGSGTWVSISNAMKNAGYDSKKIPIRARLGSTASVIQGVLNQGGISIVSAIAVQDYVDMGRLKTLSITGIPLKRHFYLTTYRRKTPSPLLERFIDFLRNHVAT